MGQPRPLFHLFLSFQTHITNFTTNRYVKKCPSSIRCWDSNSRPLEHESPLITTRPGFSAHPLVLLRSALNSYFGKTISAKERERESWGCNERTTFFKLKTNYGMTSSWEVLLAFKNCQFWNSATEPMVYHFKCKHRVLHRWSHQYLTYRWQHLPRSLGERRVLVASLVLPLLSGHSSFKNGPFRTSFIYFRLFFSQH